MLTPLFSFLNTFQTNVMSQKLVKDCGRWQLNQKLNLGKCLFFININIFRHLELKIALANSSFKCIKNGTKQFNS